MSARLDTRKLWRVNGPTEAPTFRSAVLGIAPTPAIPLGGAIGPACEPKGAFPGRGVGAVPERVATGPLRECVGRWHYGSPVVIGPQPDRGGPSGSGTFRIAAAPRPAKSGSSLTGPLVCPIVPYITAGRPTRFVSWRGNVVRGSCSGESCSDCS